jgi:hypothetical protein
MGKLTKAEYLKRATPCCGRKPLVYMRERHQFCDRCDRAYDLDTEHQINNWAWKHIGGAWVPTYPNSPATKAPGRPRTEPATRGEEGRRALTEGERHDDR